MGFRWTHLAPRAAKSDIRRKSRPGGANPGHRALLEWLEDRTLLDAAAPMSRPTFILSHPNAGGGGSGFNGSVGPIGYSPAQVRKAYGLDSIVVGGIVGDGAGQTIAIVDAYDWATAYEDLKAFDLQFGLPDPPSFIKLNQDGLPSPLPPSDKVGGWGVESALDVEWVHAAAPKANIILVEANSPFDTDLIQKAVNTARNLPGVSAVSMSFGRVEVNGVDQGLNAIFQTPAGHTGVTFLASTGDDGAPGGFPAYSPNVVAVGGTSLFLNPDNSYQSESGWSGSGGGTSQFEPKPGYQSGMSSFANRSIPDVSAIADPATGVAVYDSFDFGASTPWNAVGGTSLACPFWAGLIAVVNQERVAAGDPILDGPTQTLPLLYGLSASDFHDIITGDNGHPAGPGYDQVTGRGSPVAPRLVSDLAPLNIMVTGSPIPGAVEGTALVNVEVATFKDLTGAQPASNYIATIDWGDGSPTTRGTVVDLLNGSFSVFGSHTYVAQGTYPISVKVVNGDGLNSVGHTSVDVADAPLTPSPVTFFPTEGTRFSGVVGSFTDANPFATESDFTATIDWGDGVTTDGTLTALGGGQFTVSGMRLYQRQGVYPVRITVKDVGGASTVIVSEADVADAALSPLPKTFNAVAGLPFFGVTVASFTDANPFSVISTYTVSIDWGDGSPPTTLANGAAVAQRGNRYDVTAGHTYKRFGTYTVKVTVGDDGDATTQVVSTAIVADATLAASPQSFTTTLGETFSGVVATFTSANPFALPSDFNAPQIDWGDQSPVDTGTIIALGGNRFGVVGTHAYGAVGSFTVGVQVSSLGTSTAQAVGRADVLDALLTVTAQPQAVVAGQNISGTVATFTDAYAQAPVSYFTATIDWGDGVTTPGQITQPGGPGTTFLVAGTHAYARPQTYQITVTVSDTGGASDTKTADAVVSDAPFSVSITSLPVLTQGSNFDQAVGVLTTDNPLASTDDYIASINWGDGTTSGAVLSPKDNGTFFISAADPHFYTEPGFYPISVKVISAAGNVRSASSGVTVQSAPVVAQPADRIVVSAGSTYSGLIGSFKQYALAPPSAFTATINWGEGTVTRGVVTAGPNGTFLVSGSNVLKNPGDLTVTVTVTAASGVTGTFTVGMGVTDVPIRAAASPISAVLGSPFNGPVATFSQSNAFANPGQFVATINWGDGSTSQGTVSGADGLYTVTGSHTFPRAAASVPVSVTITHVVNGRPFATATASGSAHVLLPVTGALSHASDNGVANNDGVTSVRNPIFAGRAEPGSTVEVFAAPSSNPSAAQQVGLAVADPSGNWVVQIGPLGDGSYVMTANMVDPATGLSVQSRRLGTGDFNGPLVISTTGPTVFGVALDAPHGLLHVAFQAGPAMMNYYGLINPANYVLAVPSGLTGLTPITPTGVTFNYGPFGTMIVTLSYSRRIASGSYVLTLNAAGLTDLAGNILKETKLVTYPQSTNYPNPNYVAQIDVAPSGVAGAPHPYISLAERLAAARYSTYVQGRSIPRAFAFRRIR